MSSPLSADAKQPANSDDEAKILQEEEYTPEEHAVEAAADEEAAQSDNDSILTDLEKDDDDDDLHDFDNLDIDERPAIAVDQSNVNLIGVHKRKRADKPEASAKKERQKKPRKRRTAIEEQQELGDGPPGASVSASRRKRSEKPTRQKKAADEVPDESLTPEERRKRALDRKMDEALKRPNAQLRKVDLEAAAEKEIDNMRVRMIEAAQADSEARSNGVPAIHKLDILPQVTALLNRNSMAQYIVDPDTNILEAVRFFLEPLADGSLPAHNIQKELFASLANLPITKDTLVASGIGKVAIFYTKSNRPQPAIKRQAESLVQKWSRPILENNADIRNARRAEASNNQVSGTERAREKERQRFLAMPDTHGRARVDNTISSTQYLIAPTSEVNALPSANTANNGANSSVMKRIMSQYAARNGAGSRKRK